MFCSNCGYSMQQYYKFCPKCGTQLEGLPNQAPGQPQQPQQPQQQIPVQQQQQVPIQPVQPQPVYAQPQQVNFAQPNVNMGYGNMAFANASPTAKKFFSSPLLLVATIALAFAALMNLTMFIRQFDIIYNWFDIGMTPDAFSLTCRVLYILWSLCLSIGSIGLVISLFTSKAKVSKGMMAKYTSMILFSVFYLSGYLFGIIANIAWVIDAGFGSWSIEYIVIPEMLPYFFGLLTMVFVIILISIAKKNANTRAISIVCAIMLLVFALVTLIGESLIILDEIPYFSEVLTNRYYTAFDKFLYVFYPFIYLTATLTSCICYSILLFKNKKQHF